MSEHLIKWRDQHLNTVSPSFCAAKWYNASIFLGSGYTGSCHLPLPHQIDLEEIKQRPTALHNTQHKKKMRKMMLEGVKPAECNYCWKIEGIQRDNVSDRIFKSIIYDNPDIKKLAITKWDEDVMLKTLEISFDRQCNFACSYCNAGYSTTWLKDIENNGPYQNFVSTSGGGGAYQTNGNWADSHGRHMENSPYVEAFFKWWPELAGSLQELRVTGGEATVSQNFWRFVDIMHNNPSPNMRFAVNTNLGLSKKALDKLINITRTLPVKEFDLFTSNESFGKHAEYLRDGLHYDTWRSNLVEFIENANCRFVTIMMTVTNLALFSITEFMDDMITLKAKYGTGKPRLDLNILRWPGFMSPIILPDNLKEHVYNKLNTWYAANKENPHLEEGERASIKRLLDYIDVIETGHISMVDSKYKLFHDFKSFYSQYDTRRNKNFTATFPELKNWYDTVVLRENYDPVDLIEQDGITFAETGEYNGEDR